MSPILCPYT
ncbi:hypothetical protein CGLO_09504 [Colletotrichum gloeosporioides Cg-14]|uniref:Uncharacterized protein n=1 Tax=Colletotrichum gloeosporioides (strain Cg-14) TaxID=1237896 RepID=T0KG11_COLGC|nr:hypothetical protein CGLO_09504 [Colletotrichum gloeosporioides Cg-14]